MVTPPAPASGVPRPDPATARLVMESRRSLAARETQLADRFAHHLSGSGCPIAAARAAELLHSLLEGVQATADPEALERRWQELGARPELASFAPEGFTRMGHALVRAVRDISQDDWSCALSSGWMAFHVWMAGHLAAGAAQHPGAQRDRIAADLSYEDLLTVRDQAPSSAPDSVTLRVAPAREAR